MDGCPLRAGAGKTKQEKKKKGKKEAACSFLWSELGTWEGRGRSIGEVHGCHLRRDSGGHRHSGAGKTWERPTVAGVCWGHTGTRRSHAGAGPNLSLPPLDASGWTEAPGGTQAPLGQLSTCCPSHCPPRANRRSLGPWPCSGPLPAPLVAILGPLEAGVRREPSIHGPSPHPRRDTLLGIRLRVRVRGTCRGHQVKGGLRPLLWPGSCGGAWGQPTGLAGLRTCRTRHVHSLCIRGCR